MNFNQMTSLKTQHKEVPNVPSPNTLVLIEEMELSNDSESWTEISNNDSDEFLDETVAPVGPNFKAI